MPANYILKRLTCLDKRKLDAKYMKQLLTKPILVIEYKLDFQPSGETKLKLGYHCIAFKLHDSINYGLYRFTQATRPMWVWSFNNRVRIVSAENLNQAHIP